MNTSVSVRKIATMAGVSPATVSRALHGMKGVSEAKRQEIQDIVRRLGLSPRQRARTGTNTPEETARTQKRPYPICLLQTTTKGYLSATEPFVRQLKAITEQATLLGYDVVVAFGNTAETLPPCLLHKQVSGVLIYGGKPSRAVTEAIEGIPSVWVASHEKLAHRMVMLGNEEAGRMAADYLIAKGHERLVCFYPYEQSVMNVRLSAFETHARVRGKQVARISGPPASFPDDDATLHRWYEQRWEPLLAEWMGQNPRPTGIFCPDDALTAHLYPLLKQRGITVGKDVEVVSFGNEFSFLAGLDPRPASIDIGSETVGHQAVEMLCREIAQPSAGRDFNISIQPLLVEHKKGN